ncbi:MAG: 50S ribosomal protein L18 [Candidatus Colwellbacteria bacterium]|nr:50S ribosomal protein L18 [Candidatus Colwellbacteria bacterium]
MNKTTRARRIGRAKRTRAKIHGTAARPRLAVSRSNRNLYLQLIDDDKGRTLVFASVKELGDKKITKTEQASLLGQLLAKKAVETGIKEAIFDRRFYKYHGRVKAAAEGARGAGLTM